jgi:hypothetical protein
VFIIWRVWGWLTLLFILLTVWLATGVLEPIYRSNTGFEFVFNPEKTVLAGIAVLIVAVLFAAFVVLLLPRLERVPHNGEAMTAALQAGAEAKKAADKGTPVPVRPLAKFWKTRSSTFFIPMWVQPLIFLVIGVVMIALNLDQAMLDAADHRLDA